MHEDTSDYEQELKMTEAKIIGVKCLEVRNACYCNY